MKIYLFGRGKMANMVEKEGEKLHLNFSSNLEDADVAIHFRNKENVLKDAKLSAEKNVPLVIGTTGWHKDYFEVQSLFSKSSSAIYAPNCSIGVLLFIELAKSAFSFFTEKNGYKAHLTDRHHEKKLDAPSGTAIHIAKTYEEIWKTPLPTVSIRSGFHPGSHQIDFDSENDTITLTHTSRNRSSYAKGAIIMASWLQKKKGFFHLEDFLEDTSWR